MNGLSKYNELGVFKKFKVIAVTLSVAAASMFTLNNLVIKKDNANGIFSILTNAQVPVYRVLINEEEVGFVSSEQEAYQVISEAKVKIINETGKNLLMEPKVELIVEKASKEVLSGDINNNAYKQLTTMINECKQKAVVISIGDYQVAVKSKEDAEAVLNGSKKKYDTQNQFYIDLDATNYSSSLFNSSIVKNDIIAKDLVMTAAPVGNEMTEALETASKPILGLEFANSVVIAETYVNQSNVVTVEDAIAEITAEKMANKTYTVVAGDTLSGIARKFDTTINDLIGINEGMKETSILAIDQEIIVNVPEPKLSFVTLEEITYTENYSVDVIYVDNPNLYKGNQTVINSGSKGVKEIVAVQKKLNNKVIETEIKSEVIIKEAVPKKVSKGTKALPARVATGKYVKPLKGGTVSSSFGWRNGAQHTGVDWAAPKGTTVFAADGGTVIEAGWNGTYGKTVVINHGNGITTRYAHLSVISVSVGQKLAQYEKVGEVGSTGRSTGNHLHFELRFDRVAVNPVKYVGK